MRCWQSEEKIHHTSLRLFLEQVLLVGALHSSALEDTSVLGYPHRSKACLEKFISWVYLG